jgi:hypothetical protein
MLTSVEGPQVLLSRLMGDEWRMYPSPCRIEGSLGHVEEADDIFTHCLFAPRKAVELRGLRSNSLAIDSAPPEAPHEETLDVVSGVCCGRTSIVARGAGRGATLSADDATPSHN